VAQRVQGGRDLLSLQVHPVIVVRFNILLLIIYVSIVVLFVSSNTSKSLVPEDLEHRVLHLFLGLPSFLRIHGHLFRLEDPWCLILHFIIGAKGEERLFSLKQFPIC